MKPPPNSDELHSAPETPSVFSGHTSSPPVINDGYKRTFDLTAIIFFHIVLFPVFLALWVLIPLAIKMEDGGKIFFRQHRVGKGGRVFTLIKFRTMSENADKIDEGFPSTKGDSRITRAGRWLRMLHLDEVPQSINVIRGEMSLVGPRPLPIRLMREHLDEDPQFLLRMQVLPGITGLSQIRQGYTINGKDRARYDNLYIEKMSLLLDLEILLVSPFVVLARLWHLQG